MYHRCTQKMLAVVEDKCLWSPWCMLALSYKSLCSYLFLAFYFNFFHRKMSELRDRQKEMSKRNFEHCLSLRIIFLTVCDSCHVAPWRPPCVSGFQCLTHLPCLSVLLLQVFLFFSLFSKSKTIVWGKSLLFTKHCVWVKLYFFNEWQFLRLSGLKWIMEFKKIMETDISKLL